MSVDPLYHEAIFGGPEIGEGGVLIAGVTAIQGMLQNLANVIAQNGLQAAYSFVTPNGEPLSSLDGRARHALITTAIALNEMAPSAVSGKAGAGPVDITEAVMTLGIVPRPLPPLRHWPYAVVFDQWWDMQPWMAANSATGNVLGTEDMPTYVPDATWDSPAIPVASDADIAVSDFKWPVGITNRPYDTAVDPDGQMTPDLRAIPVKLSQVCRVFFDYDWYRTRHP